MNYEKVRQWKSKDIIHHYSQKDTILYALGLGAGYAPTDPTTLRFAYEKDLIALPSFAAILASPGFWMRDEKDLEIDFLRLLHGEQSVVLHQPLPTEGSLTGKSRVTQIIDKGKERGAIVTVEKQLFPEGSDSPIASVEQTLFLRGDGGCGGDTTAQTHTSRTPPERPADHEAQYQIRPEAALIYRLSGDFNPLHVDPATAKKAGFEQPILHGLANYGRVGFELIRLLCADAPESMRSLRARFASPVYPGDTLKLSAWELEEGWVAFEVHCTNRPLKVLSHGEAQFLRP